MPDRPFRPARETTVAVRRAASHDPANFDSSGGTDPVDRRAKVLERIAARQESPMWPYALMALLLLGGCTLTWLGQMPAWGTAALGSVALAVMVWPILFGGYGDRR
jgi:hypothetical protein